MTYNCTHCRHTWYPRTDRRPVTCPRCKSYRYDQPTKPVGRPRKAVAV